MDPPPPPPNLYPPPPISAVPTTVEPVNNNNIAPITYAAANPTHTPAPTFNHPPYAEVPLSTLT